MSEPAGAGTEAGTDPSRETARRLAGKVAIVTGASSGIGTATVHRFAREGARVVCLARNAERIAEVAEEARRLGAPDALDVPCDVGDEHAVEDAVRQVLARFGRLDVVVNNAGAMTFKPFDQLTGDDWRAVLDVDLLGAFYLTRQAFRHMPDGGSVVNVSSIHALATEPLVAPYAAAKAAVVSLTRSAAIEGAERRIRVNAVLPGAVDTPMLRDNPNVKSGAEHVDERMVGQPDEVAAVVAFLASDDASFVQGAALVVDGGRMTRL